MTTRRGRALRWAAITRGDVGAWAELTNLLAAVERTEEFYSAEDLAEELAEPGFDAARDSWAVWDGDALVAFGQLRVAASLVDTRWAQAHLDGGVHPQWRRRGIGSTLMDLMEARARVLASERHPGAPVRLRVPGRLAGDPVRALARGRGYHVARYFTDMRRDLPGPPLAGRGRDLAGRDPALVEAGGARSPGGAAAVDGMRRGAIPGRIPRVVTYQPRWAEELRSAHNDAFAAHWGSTPQTAAVWRDRLASRTFRPATSTLVLDGDTVLSYALTYQWVDGELYFGQVGTRPAARGRGWARACLVESLRRAIDAGGYTTAALTVDSANPTGAGGLYESVGFTPVRTTATYVRDEEPPAAAPQVGAGETPDGGHRGR